MYEISHENVYVSHLLFTFQMPYFYDNTKRFERIKLTVSSEELLVVIAYFMVTGKENERIAIISLQEDKCVYFPMKKLTLCLRILQEKDSKSLKMGIFTKCVSE